MISGKLEVRKLGKLFSTFEWVEEVTIYTYKTLKGYGVSEEMTVTIDVGLKDVNTIEEYNSNVALIKSYIPDVDKLEKNFDGHKIKLTAKQDKNNEICFNMRILDKEVVGKILGCKLIEVKKSYTTLTCEMKLQKV